MIASGSEPRPGAFPGAEHCWSSDDFFTMEELPESITVLGGGYIGVELAQIMQALGVKVTLVARSKPLRFLAGDMLDILLNEMRHSGLQVLDNAPHDRVEKLPDGRYRVVLQNGDSIDSDRVLSAIGRPPATRGLGLEHT